MTAKLRHYWTRAPLQQRALVRATHLSTIVLTSKRYYEHLEDEIVTPIDDRLFLLEENPFGSNGFSHCHIACMFGKLEIVRSFLDRGVDPNMHRILEFSWLEPHEHFWQIDDTCLHVAAYAGHSDVVRLLLERGADPNARNATSYTPLHYTTFDLDGSATKVLLQHGANVHARNYFDRTPLHEQMSSPIYKWDVLHALILAGADAIPVNRLAEAVPALQKLYGYIAKGYEGLPPECAEMVLRHLTWNDLRHVTQAASL